MWRQHQIRRQIIHRSKGVFENICLVWGLLTRLTLTHIHERKYCSKSKHVNTTAQLLALQEQSHINGLKRLYNVENYNVSLLTLVGETICQCLHTSEFLLKFTVTIMVIQQCRSVHFCILCNWWLSSVVTFVVMLRRVMFCATCSIMIINQLKRNLLLTYILLQSVKLLGKLTIWCLNLSYDDSESSLLRRNEQPGSIVALEVRVLRRISGPMWQRGKRLKKIIQWGTSKIIIRMNKTRRMRCATICSARGTIRNTYMYTVLACRFERTKPLTAEAQMEEY